MADINFWGKQSPTLTRNGLADASANLLSGPETIGFRSFLRQFHRYRLSGTGSEWRHVQSFTLVITETDWYFMSRWIFKKEEGSNGRGYRAAYRIIDIYTYIFFNAFYNFSRFSRDGLYYHCYVCHFWDHGLVLLPPTNCVNNFQII